MDVYQKIHSFYNEANTQKRVIGKTYFGRDIYAVRCGHGMPVGIVTYAIHGREFITAFLAQEHFKTGVFGSVWLIPLVNADGALLSQKGLGSAPKEKRKKLLAINGGSTDFSLWKANGRGVDLNVNFPADWGQGVYNVRTPSAANCIGAFPLSERESQALAKFTLEIQPDYTLSYHTKGEEIYWYYGQGQATVRRDENLANVLSLATGYPLKKTVGSVGGYKDWCIQTLKIPAFTIEVGKDAFSHPLRKSALRDIKEKNKYALRNLSKAIKEGL